MRQDRFHSAWVFSVLLHVAVLLIFVVSFELSGQMPVFENVNNNSKIISAVATHLPVTTSEPAPTPPPRVHSEPKKPEAAQPKPKPKPKPKPVVPPKPVVKEQPKPNTDAIALKKLEHKKQIAKQKEQLEKQLLADLQKQKKKIDKTKQHKALEEAMAKELRETTEKSLQQQLLNEEKQASGAKSQGIVDKYKALILQAIGDHWLVPSGVDKKLTAELLIRLAPSGAVLDVQVTRSSGDVSLDHSAKAAVFKASPLPVPSNSNEFGVFRQFVLKVKPQDIVNTAV